MLKSLTKILSLQSNYGIKQRREHDENIVALPVQLANCNVCVEENKHCNCDLTIAEDRNNTTTAEGVNVDVEHDSNADSSFAHAVINMVGMLIGKFCILLLICDSLCCKKLKKWFVNIENMCWLGTDLLRVIIFTGRCREEISTLQFSLNDFDGMQ